MNRKKDNKTICSKCLSGKSEREYYSVGNNFKEFYYNVKLPICKGCLKNSFSKKTNVKERKEFLIRIAQMLDKSCTEDILDKALSSINVVNTFMTTLNNPNNRNKSFIETVREQLIKDCKDEVKDYYLNKNKEEIEKFKLEYIPEVEEVEEVIEEVEEIIEEVEIDPFDDESKGRTPKLKDKYNLTDEIIKRWFNNDISYEEMSWCEDSYNEYSEEFQITSITRRSDIRSLINIKLLERQAIQSNDVANIAKLQRIISAKEADLGIKRSQEKNETFDSFGEKILHYENTTPLPRGALPEEYRDINFTDFKFLKEFGWTNVTAEKIGRQKFIEKYFKEIDEQINGE